MLKPAQELVDQLIQEEIAKMSWWQRIVFKLQLLWDQIYVWAYSKYLKRSIKK